MSAETGAAQASGRYNPLSWSDTRDRRLAYSHYGEQQKAALRPQPSCPSGSRVTGREAVSSLSLEACGASLGGASAGLAVACPAPCPLNPTQPLGVRDLGS